MNLIITYPHTILKEKSRLSCIKITIKVGYPSRNPTTKGVGGELKQLKSVLKYYPNYSDDLGLVKDVNCSRSCLKTIK